MMNYNDVATVVAEYLPDTYSVSAETTTKNNGVERHGIVISDGSVMAPVIYVDGYLEQGMTLEEVAIKVIDDYKNAKEMQVPFSVDELCDFHAVKELICYKLINKLANAKMLENVPYAEITDDLAIVYFLDLGDNATITINNNIIEKWGIDEDILYELASDNTPLRHPPVLRELGDVMIDMLGDELEIMKVQFGQTDMPDDEFKQFVKDEIFGNDLPLYVLTGRQAFGASAILYDDIVSMVQERFGDVYVIPSSVHELLIVPVEEAREHGLSISDLKTMVQQVNESEVVEEEQLSNNIYYINKEGMFIAQEQEEHIVSVGDER